MDKCEVTAFCEHETLSCLICNVIVGIAPQCCNKCEPKDGLVSIAGIDACGGVLRFEYDPENMVLTIHASRRVINRHIQVLKKLLHYPELVNFAECDAFE